MTKEHPLPDTRGLIRIRSHRDGSSMHRDCTGSIQPDGVPALRAVNGRGLAPLTQKLSVVDTDWQNENQFSPLESHWVDKPHLRAGPCPAVVGQHKKSSFCGLFVSYCYTQAFFFCLVYYRF